MRRDRRRDKRAKPERIGDAPIELEYRDKMNRVAQVLDNTFNGAAGGTDRKVGYVLLLFEFGEKEGRCNVISNGADRKEIVTLFREMIARFEVKGMRES
jgi:hypothetical protein